MSRIFKEKPQLDIFLMEFQNIKYGRLYLPRWTFSAHTFCCTKANPLSLLKTLQASMASRPCSPPSLNVPPLCYLGWQGLFSVPPAFCSAASCTPGAAPSALSPSQWGHSLHAGSISLCDSESQSRLQGLLFVIRWGSA